MNLIILPLFLNVVIINSLYFQDHEHTQIAEKIYLHIDRHYYDSGDDLWFKAYVIDASTNKPSPNTNNLHVELISPTLEIIQSRTIRIEDGIGNGDFHLTDTLPSGRYGIRAYTNHMRNFDDQFFFNKEIVIINPMNGGNELNDSTRYIEDKIYISFFPEGGSLIDNVTSIVAFKALNGTGKGCDVTGQLFSSKGELITTFRSLHLGMGNFNLKPASGLNYYAVIKNREGIEYRAELPKSFSSGIAIHVLVIQDHKLLLKVNTNEESLPSIINSDFTVSMSSRNLITKTITIKISSKVNNFIIPVNDFPDGIIKVTLSGIDGLALCERLVYLQNSSTISLIVSTDKLNYKPREQVKFRISLSGDSITQDTAFLSLSATESNIVNESSHFPSSIASWFLLESDVHGPVEEPSFYFDNSNENRFQYLDILLLTQGWRDFQWKYDSSNFFRHEIGFSLSGRARRILFNKPLKGAKINIGIFSDHGYSFLSTEPDSAGNFGINGIDITGKSTAIVSVTDKYDVFNGRIILDSLFYKPAIVNGRASQDMILLNTKYSELKQEALVKNSIRKKYKLSDTIRIDEVVVTAKKREQIEHVHQSRSYYIKPDKEFIITPDMETLPDIYSVLAGRIPGVEVSSTGITVRGQNPVLLLDGIPAMDINMIPPYMIDRIDVLYWSSLFGSQGANGIINVITKRGDFNYTYKEQTHSANITIKGFDVPRIFYSPKYNTPEPSAFIPDTRTTVHWEPNIVVGKGQNVSLSCFNADKTSPIEVNVEGFTSEGIPVTGKTRYEVRSDK